MILVDTSVWINLFSKNPKYSLGEEMLPSIATCPPVIQEVLQGIRDEFTYRRLYTHMTAFTCLDEKVPLDRYVKAAQLFRLAKKNGLQVRSSVDCLIASIALYYGVPITTVTGATIS